MKQYTEEEIQKICMDIGVSLRIFLHSKVMEYDGLGSTKEGTINIVRATAFLFVILSRECGAGKSACREMILKAIDDCYSEED